jgi:hypothetical protein
VDFEFDASVEIVVQLFESARKQINIDYVLVKNDLQTMLKFLFFALFFVVGVDAAVRMLDKDEQHLRALLGLFECTSDFCNKILGASPLDCNSFPNPLRESFHAAGMAVLCDTLEFCKQDTICGPAEFGYPLQIL